MKHGQLKRTVAFDAPIEVETTNGEVAHDWQEVVRVKARIEPLRGSEALGEAGPVAESDVRITITWRPALRNMTAKWRARRGATVYNLTEVPPFVPRPDREWQLLASYLDA